MCTLYIIYIWFFYDIWSYLPCIISQPCVALSLLTHGHRWLVQSKIMMLEFRSWKMIFASTRKGWCIVSILTRWWSVAWQRWRSAKPRWSKFGNEGRDTVWDVSPVLHSALWRKDCRTGVVPCRTTPQQLMHFDRKMAEMISLWLEMQGCKTPGGCFAQGLGKLLTGCLCRSLSRFWGVQRLVVCGVWAKRFDDVGCSSMVNWIGVDILYYFGSLFMYIVCVHIYI